VNLGPAVNSKSFDAYFSIYGDSIAFLASNRDGKMADLYQAKVSQTKTILREGQRYLSAEEWNTAIGKNVSGALAFPHQSTLLTAPQKELIFYIVNKILLKKDVQFHLVVKEEEDPTVTTQRITAIRDELKRQGVDQSRIHTEQVLAIEKTSRGVVEIRLFR
jgi:hypothetical protein